jgi:CRP-like cAMP-binding protein
VPGAQGFAPLGENWVLGAVPQGERDRLLARMERVRIEPKQIAYDVEQPIQHVYFPLSGMFSILAIADPRRVIEVAVVGNEGVVGVPVFLGAADTPGRAVCQIPADALRMPADAFRDEVQSAGPLHGAVRRYAQALFDQTAQTAICNSTHAIEERCARWLLMTHDRVGADTFVATQETLARMLGVQRSTVNGAAGKLQDAGLVGYARGRITIRDRAGLEAASCGCYRIIHRALARLLG